MRVIILNIFLSIFSLSFLDKCTFKKTDSGLMYKVVKLNGKSEKPKEGDVMIMNIICKTALRKEIFNTKNNVVPVVLGYSDNDASMDSKVKEAISILAVGDRVIFKLTGEQVFKDNFSTFASKYNLNKDDMLYVDIELDALLDNDGYEEWKKNKIMDIEKQKLEKMDIQLKKDIETIDKYIKGSKEYSSFKIHNTNSGLRYIIHNEGERDCAKSGNLVKVNYTGKTLNGNIFDTSIETIAKEANKYNPNRKYEPIEFTVGVGQVIKGWDEILQLLKKGSKATVFIPSTLAYGPNQVSNEITANSILIFNVELVDIK